MITRAAIKHNGVIYIGKQNQRHSDIINTIAVKYNLEISNSSILGFITDDGNFLNRKLAAIHAFDSNQIKDKICPDSIISEDLW